MSKRDQRIEFALAVLPCCLLLLSDRQEAWAKGATIVLAVVFLALTCVLGLSIVKRMNDGWPEPKRELIAQTPPDGC